MIAAGVMTVAPVVSCSGEREAAEIVGGNEILGWGLPVISVACVRAEPRHGSELVSQCLLGVPVAVMGHDGEWLDVMTPEGYRGWVNQSSVAEKTEDEMSEWRCAERYVVDSPSEIRVWTNESDKGEAVTDLVDGCIVEGGVDNDSGVLRVVLPDGRTGFADVSDFVTMEEWCAQNYDTEKIIARAESLMGVPYLWGGLSTKSMDCSGLVKLCHWANGIIVMRDASQQAGCGEAVDRKDIKRGDLLFFGNEETGRVTHVGIYEGDSMYVHCSGRVRRNSVDRESADFMDKHYLSSRRWENAIGSDGLTKVKDHPWFFNLK